MPLADACPFWRQQWARAVQLSAPSHCSNSGSPAVLKHAVQEERSGRHPGRGRSGGSVADVRDLREMESPAGRRAASRTVRGGPVFSVPVSRRAICISIEAGFQLRVLFAAIREIPRKGRHPPHKEVMEYWRYASSLCHAKRVDVVRYVKRSLLCSPGTHRKEFTPCEPAC